MSESERRNTDFLDISAQHIEKRFGNSIDFTVQSDDGYLHAGRIVPQDGGKVCKFDETKLGWFPCGQDFTYWNVKESGKVCVGYPQDSFEDGVLNFQIGHPREVAELLHLFVQPSARMTAEISESQFFKLGKIADLYAVIASKDGLRVLDLSRLPATMPEGVRTTLALNLTQNWDRLYAGEDCPARELEDRWPDFVGGLPDAAPFLRAGYFVDLNCCLQPGYRLLQGAAGEYAPFSVILFVPHDDVSAFYLGEYLEYDRNVVKNMRDALAVKNDLETVCALLKKTPICMPADFTDQIKLVAQTNLLRYRLIDKAKQLVYARAPYRDLSARHQAAGHALGRMIDACEKCSLAR